MNFGAGDFAAIDPVHEIQVRVGLDAAVVRRLVTPPGQRNFRHTYVFNRIDAKESQPIQATQP